MSEEEQYLKWRVDVNTFRLLGRELITDRVTAIFELVKNCYDANASKVDIIISNSSTTSTKSRIIIKDNGDGMTFNDVQDKWMVVGTNSKRANQYSGPPYNRKLVGEKGVGRFAVEKLGSALLLRSKKKGDSESVCVEIDWNAYENLSAKNDSDKRLPVDVASITQDDIEEDKLYFTDVKNRYWYEKAIKSKKGTELCISRLREVWTEDDITRLERELSRLISPLDNKSIKFTINITAADFEKYKKTQKVENKLFEQSAYKIDLKFDEKTGTQDVIKFNETKLETATRPIYPMGPVRMVLYYFDSEAKKKFKAAFLGDAPDGIKVYRDGLIATPFAETTNDENKKRDILGIDKRKYNAFFEKVGNRDLLGVVEITKKLNPAIIDSTSRQDFVDNTAYTELKNFIFDQIIQIEKYLKHKRNIEKAKVSSSMDSAKSELTAFTRIVRRIASETPALAIKLHPLIEASQRIKADFDKGVKAYNLLQKDKDRQENLFMSLMSLQQYAAQMAHVVRIAISRVLHLAEFFKEFFPNPEFDSDFKEYSQQIFGEMLTLNNVINYMLSYALADTEKVEINVATVIQDLLSVKYAELFKKENIHSSFEINKTVVIVANQRFFLDIFENMVANSIKALAGFADKLIKCTATIEDSRVIVLFSDNGIGIPPQNRERIFDVYFTTTAEQGGAGLGLFVVKSRVDALKGTVEVIDSEFGSRGTTFKIVLPFDN